MLKNPTVIFTCLNCGLVPVSVITLSSMRHGLVEALGKGVSTYLMLAPLFAGLAAAGYLILAALYGWKYLVLLRWMNSGIVHIQQDKQFRAAQGIALAKHCHGLKQNN